MWNLCDLTNKVEIWSLIVHFLGVFRFNLFHKLRLGAFATKKLCKHFSWNPPKHFSLLFDSFTVWNSNINCFYLTLFHTCIDLWCNCCETFLGAGMQASFLDTFFLLIFLDYFAEWSFVQRWGSHRIVNVAPGGGHGTYLCACHSLIFHFKI